jgi:hypothetical protein
VVASRLLKHVGDQFGGDRRPTLILLVLTRIGEEGDDGGNPFRAGNLTGVNHDTEFHECSVDLTATSVDDIDVILPHGLCDAHVGFTNSGFRDCGSSDGNTETVGDVRNVREWKTVSSTVWRRFLLVLDDWSLSGGCMRLGVQRNRAAKPPHR